VKRRAFTLIEVAVSLALIGGLLSVIVSIMATTLADGRRARAQAEIQRDATFVTQLLNTELRQAGLGVPRQFDDGCRDDGANIRFDCTTGIGCVASYGTTRTSVATGAVVQGVGNLAGITFSSSVILANSTQVGILGDLPRPDSQYNAYGPLHTRPMGGLPGTDDANSAKRIMWHNENNGSCAPLENSTTPAVSACSTANTSLFFPGASAQLCTTIGANVNDRTCPWGMRRVIGGEHIQIVAGDFGWSTAALSGTLTTASMSMPASEGGGSHLAMTLTVPFDAAVSSGVVPGEDTKWRNQTKGEGPGGINGQGWVTTLDRVFFIFDQPSPPTPGTLLRIQCYGDPDPNAAGWPNASVASLSPPYTGLNITPPVASPMTGADVAANICVGPEVVARNVKSVTFSYFDSNGNALASPVTGVGLPTCGAAPTPATSGKNAVRRIDYVINFEKKVSQSGTSVVKHTIQGSVRLQNLSALH
jgi:prepilin-type N-terminal cleavage/methylation domain-containing protein